MLVEVCGMCREESETVEYTILHCNKIAPIWYASPLRMNMRQHHGRSFKELLWENMAKQPLEVPSMIAFTAWEI